MRPLAEAISSSAMPRDGSAALRPILAAPIAAPSPRKANVEDRRCALLGDTV
jgi:hypothetical protein